MRAAVRRSADCELHTAPGVTAALNFREGIVVAVGARLREVFIGAVAFGGMGLGLLSRPPTRAPSSPRAMRLRRLSSGRCVELQEPVARSRGIVLGRSEARTDVVVGDSTKISRTHAVITLTERHEWVIGDLSSTNGLYVNGVLRKRHILKPNDVISFVERCRFGFVFEESPAECPPDNATSDRVGTKRKRSSNDEPDADDVRVSKRQDIMYELTCRYRVHPSCSVGLLSVPA